MKKFNDPIIRRKENETQKTIVQPKLKVSDPGDKSEHEADTVADQVMRMPNEEEQQAVQMQPEEEEESTVSMQPEEEEDKVSMQTEEEEESTSLQMKEEEEESSGIQMKEEEEENPSISMQADDSEEKIIKASEEEEKVQTKSYKNSEDKTRHASPEVARKLENNQSGGQPLPEKTNSELSQKMGNDFSDVKVHTDSNAVQLNKDLKSKAFTHKNHIYFNQGQFAPDNSDGKQLLAHELTHTVQQTGGKESLSQRKPENKLIQRQTSPKVKTAPVSPSLFLLKGHWKNNNKGEFFQVLRNLNSQERNDVNTVSFINNNLTGDDLWLSKSILKYGRESGWPLHMKIYREMKGWKTCKGKNKVFRLMREVGGPSKDADVKKAVAAVFSNSADDLWLANTILAHGPEPLWPETELTKRHKLSKTARWKVNDRAITASLGKTAGGRKIQAYFFPGITAKRALVLGGVHGSELSGVQVAMQLIKILKAGTLPYYSVTIVPQLFPDNVAAREQKIASTKNKWKKLAVFRSNFGRYTLGKKKKVDPNRQFPLPGKTYNPSDPKDRLQGIIEQENQILLKLIERFKPERIANIHAIHSPAQAGIYADPRTDESGIALGFASDKALALAMAERAAKGGAGVRGNKLTKKGKKGKYSTAIYPKDPRAVAAGKRQRRSHQNWKFKPRKGKGISLGTWASTAIKDKLNPSKNRSAIQVITVEVATTKRIEDMPKKKQAARRKEIESHADAIREIFLGK